MLVPSDRESMPQFNQDVFKKSKKQNCLEDHRLMIDHAIDKLKGELRQKETE